MTSGQCDEISAEAAPRSHPGNIPQGRERRATLRALKSWTSAREDAEIPILADLSGGAGPEAEPEIFTENQFLFMVDADLTNSVVIFYGSELPNMPIWRNVRSSLQHALPAALRTIFHDACMEAANNGDVVHRHGMISTPSGGGVLYRSIFMPLRSGSHPNHIYIFGAFSNEDGGAERLAAA